MVWDCEICGSNNESRHGVHVPAVSQRELNRHAKKQSK